MHPRDPVIDLTMGLLNRTAVYDLGLELAKLSPASPVRYWRWINRSPIQFGASNLLSFAGKALGRLALRDLASPRMINWPRGGGAMVFVDPLFASKTHVEAADTILCHDVAPISNPEYYDAGAGIAYDEAYKRIQAARPGVVFVSKITRDKFLDRYPAKYRFTKVVSLYFKPQLANLGNPLPPEVVAPYFLMVGGMERRKNFASAIEAFDQSGLGREGYHMYITGPRGNASAAILPAVSNHPFVSHLGFVDTYTLAALYAGATAHFFPSLIEGFGVPALEATRLGALTIVSAGTVLEEVVGPDGLTVDPRSVASMAQGLRRAAAMSHEERQRLVAAVGQYQSRFSIEAFRAAWTEILAS